MAGLNLPGVLKVGLMFLIIRLHLGIGDLQLPVLKLPQVFPKEDPFPEFNGILLLLFLIFRDTLLNVLLSADAGFFRRAQKDTLPQKDVQKLFFAFDRGEVVMVRPRKVQELALKILVGDLDASGAQKDLLFALLASRDHEPADP